MRTYLIPALILLLITAIPSVIAEGMETEEPAYLGGATASMILLSVLGVAAYKRSQEKDEDPEEEW